MKARRLTGVLAVPAIALGSLAIWHGASTSHAPTGTLKPCTGLVVTISDYNPNTGCDVRPPQRLDIRYHFAAINGATMADARQFCDDDGGDDLIGNGKDANGEWVFTCEGIDY